MNCPIPKEKHKKILGGQGGVTLKKLIQETGVRVTIPSANNSDAVIKVEGTQAAVDKTVAWLYQVTKDKVRQPTLATQLCISDLCTGG